MSIEFFFTEEREKEEESIHVEQALNHGMCLIVVVRLASMLGFEGGSHQWGH